MHTVLFATSIQLETDLEEVIGTTADVSLLRDLKERRPDWLTDGRFRTPPEPDWSIKVIPWGSEVSRQLVVNFHERRKLADREFLVFATMFDPRTHDNIKLLHALLPKATMRMEDLCLKASERWVAFVLIDPSPKEDRPPEGVFVLPTQEDLMVSPGYDYEELAFSDRFVAELHERVTTMHEFAALS
jgi:hypothetical protein